MGQDEVLKVLKKNKGWMISGEIASILEQPRATIGRTLTALLKHDEVIREIIITMKGKKYLWKYKS